MGDRYLKDEWPSWMKYNPTDNGLAGGPTTPAPVAPVAPAPRSPDPVPAPPASRPPAPAPVLAAPPSRANPGGGGSVPPVVNFPIPSRTGTRPSAPSFDRAGYRAARDEWGGQRENWLDQLRALVRNPAERGNVGQWHEDNPFPRHPSPRTYITR